MLKSVPCRLAVTIVNGSLTEPVDLPGTLPDRIKIVIKMSRRGADPIIKFVADDEIFSFDIDTDRSFCVTGKSDYLCVKSICRQVIAVLDENEIVGFLDFCLPLHLK